MTDTITTPAPRRDAFHALGTPIPSGLTVAEAMEHAHMNRWNVRKTPLHAVIDDGDGGVTYVTVPNRHVVLRDSPFTGKPESLGVVGNWWKPFANEDTVGLLTTLVDESDAELSTVGVLGDGRKTFFSMRMPGHMEFTSPVDGSKDITDLYLSVFNSHDGNGSLLAMVSPIRLMCCNQQRIAEATAKSTFKLRHTGNTVAKLSEVRSLLGLTFKYQDTFAAECEKMIAHSMENVEVFAIMQQVFGVAEATTERQTASRIETASKVFELYKQSDTVAPFRGTAFGAYNAITEYTDHYMSVGRKGGEADQRAVRTLTSDALGEIKSRAYSVLVPA